MPDLYVLVGREPTPEPDVLKWGRWFQAADRTVKLTLRDEVSVSTVFLGIDHSFASTGGPVLFETLVFVNGMAEGGERYRTWAEAEAGHDAWVRKIFRSEIPHHV